MKSKKPAFPLDNKFYIFLYLLAVLVILIPAVFVVVNNIDFPPWTAILPFVAALGIIGLAELQKESRYQKYRNDLKNYSYQTGDERFDRYPDRDFLPIKGPPVFEDAVRRLLGELKERAPHRYKEVTECLPKAEYDHSLNYGTAWKAYSDGNFGFDGSDYAFFRFVFLHEVGHNVRPGQGEDAANQYAVEALRDIGIEWH